ncbi:site-specific DNA-methyltransferase, partial [bacterium]|nr:site-specific DNA-methyltransferase [bacterium]
GLLRSASRLTRCIKILGKNALMAYLVMMTGRLVELHRVLKRTGSLYVHCDPTASHYLKIILDAIFGAKHFRNEIIWQRTSAHNDAKKWARVHDVLLYYTKSDTFTWNGVYTGHNASYVDDFYRHEDERGVYRLDHIIRSKSMGKRPNLSYELTVIRLNGAGAQNKKNWRRWLLTDACTGAKQDGLT